MKLSYCSDVCIVSPDMSCQLSYHFSCVISDYNATGRTRPNPGRNRSQTYVPLQNQQQPTSPVSVRAPNPITTSKTNQLPNSSQPRNVPTAQTAGLPGQAGSVSSTNASKIQQQSISQHSLPETFQNLHVTEQEASVPSNSGVKRSQSFTGPTLQQQPQGPPVRPAYNYGKDPVCLMF